MSSDATPSSRSAATQSASRRHFVADLRYVYVARAAMRLSLGVRLCARHRRERQRGPSLQHPAQRGIDPRTSASIVAFCVLSPHRAGPWARSSRRLHPQCQKSWGGRPARSRERPGPWSHKRVWDLKGDLLTDRGRSLSVRTLARTAAARTCIGYLRPRAQACLLYTSPSPRD